MYFKLTAFFICLIYIIGGECVIEQNYTPAITENNLHLNKSNGTINVISHALPIINKNGTANPQYVEIVNNEHVKAKKAKKRKKKNKKKRNNQALKQNSSLVETTTADSNSSTPKTTRRRKKRRRRKKKKKSQNDILEISISRNLTLNNPIKISNDSNVANLIEQLNKNPEEDFSSGLLSSFSNNNTITRSGVKIKLGQDLVTTGNSTKYSNTKKRSRCSKNNGGCSQICKTRGKTKCSCLRGYVLSKNRKKCVDIDECKINNGGCKEICKNILGAYYCDCPAGFRISDDLKSCQDVNECHLRNGHGPCQDTCTNTYGSYICDCSHLNGSRLADDKHSCQDINECAEGSSGCSHTCINTALRAFCSCPEGMELMSDYKTCQDIDECEDISIGRNCIRGCVNTIGSYYCEEDFQNDQGWNRTKVPVCPPLDPPQYGFISCPRNNSLPYDTFSSNGRKIVKNSPGTKCQLICPIGFKLMGGGGRYVCGVSGNWIMKKKGFCIKAPSPKLECPANQTISLDKGRDKVKVNFPPPRTNVRWRIVKSYPKWAKNLEGDLGEGHHSILFSVTDPATRLSSSCLFSITIKNKFYFFRFI